MAIAADANIYLKYGNKPKGKAKAILWPVRIFTVLYPEVKRHETNLFERAIMRLIRAKVTEAEEISTLTGLHPDLVKLIQSLLVSKYWLNEQANELTQQGIKLIEQEDEDNSKTMLGYLFQDAISGKLWPRIAKNKSFIEPIDQHALRPEFIVDRKTGYSIKPYKPIYPRTKLFKPSTRDSIRAWQDYREDFFSAQQYTNSKNNQQLVKNALAIKSENGELAWMVIWLTTTNSSKIWSIKDPFDLRDEAWWLQDDFFLLLDKNPELQKKLAHLIDKAEPEKQTAREWLQSIKNDIYLRILINHQWLEEEPDIRDAFAVLLSRKEKLQAGQKEKSDLEAAITECQKLLEVLMQWLIKTFTLVDTQSLPKSNRNDDKINKKLLENLGLPAFNEEVIKVLAKQKLPEAIKALRTPTSSLKALLFAASLTTTNNTQHPLSVLNGKQLQLNKLLDLANLRNQTSHGNSRYTGKKYEDLTSDITHQHIDYALSFVEQFKEYICGKK